ncbi:MAG: hypothetical protein HKN99_01510, partial [Winogradskyella sp.]|nr:hypothetical protein [Winogradskyella sp.]
MLKSKFYISLFIAFVLSAVAFSQNRITIEYAGTGYADPNIENGAKIFLRDKSQQVHFVHEGINMWCDKAIYYEKEDFIEAFSN